MDSLQPHATQGTSYKFSDQILENMHNRKWQILSGIVLIGIGAVIAAYAMPIILATVSVVHTADTYTILVNVLTFELAKMSAIMLMVPAMFASCAGITLICTGLFISPTNTPSKT